jgi:hypothetical protein
MNLATEANAHYMAHKDDAIACAAIRKEAAALGLSILIDANAGATITSATVNGQSFSATGAMKQSYRLQLLREIVRRLDHGRTISSFQQIHF